MKFVFKRITLDEFIVKSLTPKLKSKVIFVHYGKEQEKEERDKTQVIAQVSLGHT